MSNRKPTRPVDKNGIADLSGEKWRHHQPKPERDIRKGKKPFFSLEAAKKERRKRCDTILRKPFLQNEEPDSLDRSILRIMGTAKPNKSAPITCCPLLARRFQIYFSSCALRIDERIREIKGAPIVATLIDLNDATISLDTVNSRMMHDRFRHRLQTYLGMDVVVIGFLEVEWDRSRRMWQPHYHTAIYRANERDLDALRKKHYKQSKGERTEGKRMVVEEEKGIAGAFSYMSKLVAFAKIPRKRWKPKRVRLRPPQEREFFRFLAKHRPTEFVFCLNCSIVKGRGR